jgi:hypothetical protein
MPKARRLQGRKLSVPVSLHNVTLPNEIALMSFRARLKTVDRLAPAEMSESTRDPQRYIDRISELADAVDSERTRMMRQKRVSAALKDWEYIISVPSVHWTHYRGAQSRERENAYSGSWWTGSPRQRGH